MITLGRGVGVAVSNVNGVGDGGKVGNTKGVGVGDAGLGGVEAREAAGEVVERGRRVRAERLARGQLAAASVAGVLKKNKEGYIKKGSTVVCILTGHGLKDPDRAIAISSKTIKLPSDTAAIAKHLGL